MLCGKENADWKPPKGSQNVLFYFIFFIMFTCM